MAAIPRISTDRLLLRGWARNDFEAFASIVMDPKRPTPPGPMDRRTAWRHFTAGIGLWELDGIGWWAVEDRKTGALAGTVGAFHREPPPGPNAEDDLEIGWSLVAEYRGKGIATEASKAMLAHVVDTRRSKRERVIAHIDHDNPASIRVAEKLGMRYEREIEFYDCKVRRYVL